MPSEEQFQEELKQAMKARDMDKVYVLRSMIAAIKNMKVEKRVDSLPEAEIAALVRKEVSKRTEAAEFARKAERAELAAQNEKEKAILDAYLPQLMGAEALERAVREISADLGTTQIGPIMAKLREKYSGQYDGKLASELIRKLG
jgi:uncharacterized protein YqeY